MFYLQRNGVARCFCGAPTLPCMVSCDRIFSGIPRHTEGAFCDVGMCCSMPAEDSVFYIRHRRGMKYKGTFYRSLWSPFSEDIGDCAEWMSALIRS